MENQLQDFMVDDFNRTLSQEIREAEFDLKYISQKMKEKSSKVQFSAQINQLMSLLEELSKIDLDWLEENNKPLYEFGIGFIIKLILDTQQALHVLKTERANPEIPLHFETQEISSLVHQLRDKVLQ